MSVANLLSLLSNDTCVYTESGYLSLINFLLLFDAALLTGWLYKSEAVDVVHGWASSREHHRLAMG